MSAAKRNRVSDAKITNDLIKCPKCKKRFKKAREKKKTNEIENKQTTEQSVEQEEVAKYCPFCGHEVESQDEML